jgi:hypothetical protein
MAIVTLLGLGRGFVFGGGEIHQEPFLENLSIVEAPRQTQIIVTQPATRSGLGTKSISLNELKARVTNIKNEPTIAIILLVLGESVSS